MYISDLTYHYTSIPYIIEIMDIGTVEDVNKSVFRYILGYPKTLALFIALSLALEAIGIRGNYGEEFIILPILVAVLAIFWIQYKIRREFMRQFASRNGYQYRVSGSSDEYNGALFDKGRAKSVSDVVTGIYEGRPIEFFFYQYTEGSGKESHTYYFTVVKIEYGGAVPSIVVEKKSVFNTIGLARGNQKKLNLGKGFDDYFTVYVPEDFEIETFEIFTPEIMQMILDRGKEFSFEFIGNKLYVYKQSITTKRIVLDSLLSFTKEIIATLGPRLARLHDDVEAITAATEKTARH